MCITLAMGFIQRTPLFFLIKNRTDTFVFSMKKYVTNILPNNDILSFENRFANNKKLQAKAECLDLIAHPNIYLTYIVFAWTAVAE